MKKSKIWTDKQKMTIKWINQWEGQRSEQSKPAKKRSTKGIKNLERTN